MVISWAIRQTWLVPSTGFHLLNHPSATWGSTCDLSVVGTYGCSSNTPIDRWNPPVAIQKWAPITLNATSRAPGCPQPPCSMPSSLCPLTVRYSWAKKFNTFSFNCCSSPKIVSIWTSSRHWTQHQALCPSWCSFQVVTFSSSMPQLPSTTRNVWLILLTSSLSSSNTDLVSVFTSREQSISTCFTGVLGFFTTGSGPNDIKGNYGVLDQRFAIAWVKANIDAFGGDPNQVYLNREKTTRLLLRSSIDHPLWPKCRRTVGCTALRDQRYATVFSASHRSKCSHDHFIQVSFLHPSQWLNEIEGVLAHSSRTYDQYVAPGVLLSEQLRCAYSDIACFRNASVDRIVAAQAIVDNMLTSLELILFFEPWVPVIDHVIVHGQLYETIQNTTFPLKPLIIGTLTEESQFFIYSAWNKSISPTFYGEILLAFFREKAPKVLKRFPPVGTGDQRPLLARIATQWVFACTNRIFARKAASYAYVFGFPLDFDGWGFWTFCNGHVCHGAELPFVFESAWMNFTNAGQRVSGSMAAYWANFATSQDPNEPLRVATPWPRVTTGNEKYMYFQDPLQVEESYIKDDCDFWDEIGYKREHFDL